MEKTNRELKGWSFHPNKNKWNENRRKKKALKKSLNPEQAIEENRTAYQNRKAKMEALKLSNPALYAELMEKRREQNRKAIQKYRSEKVKKYD